MEFKYSRLWFYLLTFFLFIVVLSVYIFTLPPSFTTKGDAAEFAVSTLINGVPHPPGYPLFIIIAKLFLLIPVGLLPYRINLVSAFFGALTVVFMALILRKLTKNDVISLAVSLVLAFYFLFWKYSIVSEVFILNTFFATLLFYLALTAGKQIKLVYLFFFLVGIAFTNHQTIVLIIPSLLYLLVSRFGIKIFTIKNLLVSAGLFTLGFFPYIYVLWAARGQALINWDHATNLPKLLHLILRLSYGWFKLAGVELPIKSQGLQILDYFKTLFTQFSAVGVVLAVVGLAFLFSRKRDIFITTLSAFLLSGLIFILYGRAPIGDMRFVVITERFFLLPNIFMVIWIGVGAGGLIRLLGNKLKKYPSKVYSSFLIFSYLLVLAYPSFLFYSNFSAVDERNNYFVPNLMEDIFVDVPEGSVLMVTGDTKIAVSAYIINENKKSNLKVVFPDDLMEPRSDWYIPALRARFPSLIIPDKKSGEEEKEYVTRFIKDNMEKYPVVCACGQYRERLKLPVAARTVGLLEFFVKEAPKDEKLDKLEQESDLLMAKYKNLNPKKNFPITYMEEDIYREYAFPYVRLGNTNLITKNYSEAERLYKKALSIGPANYSVHADLGRVYFEMGKYKEAINQWGEYIKINPYDKNVPSIEKKISEAKEKLNSQ